MLAREFEDWECGGEDRKYQLQCSRGGLGSRIMISDEPVVIQIITTLAVATWIQKFGCLLLCSYPGLFLMFSRGGGGGGGRGGEE